MKSDQANWKSMPLEEWMEAIIDYRGKTPAKTSAGIPLITAKIVKAGRIMEPEEFIAEEDYETWMRRGMPKPGDVVLTTEAPLGEVAQLDDRKVALAQRIITLRGKPDLLDNTYLKFALQGSFIQEQLHGRASGSTVTGIKQSELRKMPLSFPNIQQQKSVAKILGSLDNKINTNRRINQTLEAMAQAIFKSWFVDFDPVKAKIAAKQTGRDPLRAAMSAISGKSAAELDTLPPEQYHQLATTAELFPDALVALTLSAVPSGWSYQAAEALSEVGIGKTPPRKESEWFTDGVGDWRWVSIRDMGSSGVFQRQSSEFLTADAVSRFNVRVVPDRTVILSFKLTVGRVAITDGPMVTNEAIAHFRLADDACLSPEYLYLYLKGFDYSTLGSTSSIADAVNSKTIRDMPIIVANRDLIDRFTKIVSPIFEEIRNRQNEIASLQATRDALLPKLLSGEIEVPI
ncbi:MAG TPA: restriction endonuclease subunit S [Cellvibrionaceae bacterium]|nr:restriction endonuclease subunit S [Cellvibrionaceae bacterium]